MSNGFNEAAFIVLSCWTSLKIACDLNNIEFTTQSPLYLSVLDYFATTKTPDVDDLGDFLYNYLEEEFAVVLEEDSHLSVAITLNDLYQKIVLQNDATELLKLREFAAQRGNIAVVQGEHVDEDGDDDIMEEEPQQQQIVRPPKQEPIVDDEGFTLVQRRRRN